MEEKEIMERQKHGFLFEEKIIENFGLIKENNYTSRWDAFTTNGTPVSIKVEKIGSDIELADYFRNADINQDFYLIVGFWKDDKTNIVETRVLKIKGREWQELFISEFSELLHDLLSSITNDKKDDTKWKTKTKEIKKLWKEKTKNLIRPRFKRDHKTQKRVQCAINNKDFYNYFIPRYEVEYV